MSGKARAARGESGGAPAWKKAALVGLPLVALLFAGERVTEVCAERAMSRASEYVSRAWGGELRYGRVWFYPGFTGVKGRLCGVYLAYPAADMRAEIPDCVRIYVPYYGTSVVAEIPAVGKYRFSGGKNTFSFSEDVAVTISFAKKRSPVSRLSRLADGREGAVSAALSASAGVVTAPAVAGSPDGDVSEVASLREPGRAEGVTAEWFRAEGGEGGVFRFSVKALYAELPKGYRKPGLFPASLRGKMTLTREAADGPGALRIDGILVDFSDFALRFLGTVRAAEAGDLFPSTKLRLEVTDLAAASASPLTAFALKLPPSDDVGRADAVSVFLRRYAEKPAEGEGGAFVLERASLGKLTFGGAAPEEIAGAWSALRSWSRRSAAAPAPVSEFSSPSRKELRKVLHK